MDSVVGFLDDIHRAVGDNILILRDYLVTLGMPDCIFWAILGTFTWGLLFYVLYRLFKDKNPERSYQDADRQKKQ